MYRAMPHNSVLGWLLFGGLIGFTGLWSLWMLTIFLAARSYHRAHRPEDRTAALCCIAAILICAVQAYGDLGLGSLQSKIFVALAATFAGKLAVDTGAWPTRRKRTAFSSGAPWITDQRSGA